MTKDNDTPLKQTTDQPQPPQPTNLTQVTPDSNASAERSKNVKKAARKTSQATAGEAAAAATTDASIDTNSKAGNGNAVTAATEATAGNSTDKSSNNGEGVTPTTMGEGSVIVQKDELQYLLAEYTSRVLNVPIAVGAVLCFAYVTDQTLLNLNVNQAAPDEKRLVELMKSFTPWGNRVKSFTTDKIVALLCSKDGLAKKNLEDYVSPQPIR